MVTTITQFATHQTRPNPPHPLGRRAFVQGALLGVSGLATDVGRGHPIYAASGSATPGTNDTTVLLAYFSRPGENYYHGDRIDLEVGNTAVLAGMMSDRIVCDVHRIEAADPYPADYEATVERNVREQRADARPEIANPLESIERYQVVLLGSPIWNVRAPMIMSTFAERFDFTGKTLIPFTTHAMSGLGTTERDYAALCPGATIGEGLAVRGEEVIDAPDDAAAAVESWLQGANVLSGTSAS